MKPSGQHILQFGLFGVLSLTTCFFGGVHVWVYTGMELAIYLLLGYSLVREGLLPGRIQGGALLDSFREWTHPRTWLFLLLLFTLFQCLPLPFPALEWLSPQAARLHNPAGVLPDSSAAPTAAALSLVRHETGLFSLKLLAYFGFFILFLSAFRERKDLERAGRGLAGLGLLFALYGLFETFSGHKHILWWEHAFRGSDTRMFGPFINPDHFALYLECIIPLCFGMLFTAWQGRNRGTRRNWTGLSRLQRIKRALARDDEKLQQMLLLLVITVFLFLAQIFTASRAGITSLAASLGLMTGLALYKSRSKGFLWLLLFFWGLALIYALRMDVTQVLIRFEGLGLDPLSGSSRLQYYIAVLDLIPSFPVFGTGMGTFSDVYPLVQPAGSPFIRYLHNDWLQMLVEGGFVGFGIVVCGFALVLVKMMRQFFRRQRFLAVGYGLGSIGAIVAVGLHSLLDFGLRMPANVLMLLALVAVGWNALHVGRARQGEERERQRAKYKKRGRLDDKNQRDGWMNKTQRGTDG